MGGDPEWLLHILCKTLLSEVRLDQPDLTLRQLAIMLEVYQTDELQTVRGLAALLSVGRPIITRSLDRLAELNLACRQADPSHRGSITIGRTARGTALVDRLGVAMAQAAVAAETYTAARDGTEQEPTDV